MKIDKESVKKSFSKSAANYDRYANLHEEIISKLFSQLSGDYGSILDIGAGTGTFIEMLSDKYPRAKMVGIDIAPGMVEVAASKVKRGNVGFLLGDGELLPFDDNQFDLVVSSASLQWMEPEKVFAEIGRVLQSQGEFYFTTFGPATLCEIKKAGLAVNLFPQKEELIKILSTYFAKAKINAEVVTRYYADIFELFNYLIEIGAQNPMEPASRGLTKKNKINSLFSKNEKGIEVSYEIYYGSCQKTT